jgi:hypothetical protein
MNRTVMAVATTLGAVCMLGATSAHAQENREEFGRRGQFIIGADRLMSLFTVTHDTVSLDNGDGTKTVYGNTQTSMSFFYGYNPPGEETVAGALPQRWFYSVPRVGFDYTVVNNVTVGGEIILFFTLGGNTTTKFPSGGGSTTEVKTGSPNTTLFGIAPRGGYIYRISNLLSLWGRGGFSFYTASAKSTLTDNMGNTLNTQTNSAHVFTLDLDPQLVVTPLPNIGLTAGLTFDIPLGGGFSQENKSGGNPSTTVTHSGNATAFYFGVTLGMLIHF